MKNARELWDQDLHQNAAGGAEMECNEPKKKPKFTGGKGPKRLKGKHLWNKEGITFFNTADKNWKKLYNDEKLRGVLFKGWEKWLEECGRKLRIGDGSNKTLHSIMATWEDDEIDDSKVASKRRSGDSSEEDSGKETDRGYDSDKAKDYGCGSWRDLKIKLQGEQTCRNLLDEMSDDRVGEDDCIGSEREETAGRARRTKKTDERKSESEAKSRRTSPRKGRTENTLSPVRRSGRGKCRDK
jgi:hypothetical protein